MNRSVRPEASLGLRRSSPLAACHGVLQFGGPVLMPARWLWNVLNLGHYAVCASVRSPKILGPVPTTDERANHELVLS